MGASQQLFLLLLALAAAPFRVSARVDIVPALLVHEEHLPPIDREPTYTLARFVQELLKMQGDEIYRGFNSIQTSNRIKPSFVSSNRNSVKSYSNLKAAVLDGKNFGSYNIKRSRPSTTTTTEQPFARIRINNSFRQQRVSSVFPSHTQVIYNPAKAAKLIDLSGSSTTTTSTTTTTANRVETDADRISITTRAPQSDIFSTVTAPSLINEAILLQSYTLDPISSFQDTNFISSTPAASTSTPSTTSTSSVAPAPLISSTPSVSSTTTVPSTTTIDIVDFIRNELKSNKKPSPRPFIAGKIFRKRNSESEWRAVNIK